MIGTITKQTPISLYQPSKEVVELTNAVQKDYFEGVRIIEEPTTELNDRSVIQDENRGQMMFNQFVDISSKNLNEDWKWRGTRSMARNKGIAMHAQLTANYLLPVFTAQNENDDLDKDFSEIMRDVIEWMALPSNSNYQQSFLQIVFGMMTNPVTFLEASYCEVMQTVKEKTKQGYTKKQIADEILSGFKANIWSSSQVLIANAYERNIQKQRFIIKRRYVDRAELEAKWGDHSNWDNVKTGIKTVYNNENNLYYDVYDDENPTLVAEETYLNRREDLEVTFLGGIYMGDKNVDNNPIKHRDHRGAPKYNVTPFGYSRIGNHYFYYKSMMNSLGWDNMLYDAMSEVVMNRALLEVDMPMAVFGTDKVDSEIVFPSAVVAFEDKDASITPLIPNTNMAAGFQALEATKASINEESTNDVMSGNLPQASQKVGNVARAGQSARKIISGVGKSLAESILQFGDLMKDIVVNNITVAQIEELSNGKTVMKYRKFILEKKQEKGGIVDKVNIFDEKLIGKKMNDKQRKYANAKLLEQSGYPKKKKVLRIINPEMFAKFKYLCRVDVEEMFTKNAEYWQQMLMALKGQLAEDPYVDQEGLTRRLLYSFFQSAGDDLMKEESQIVPGVPQMPPQAQPGQQPQVGSNMAQQAQNKMTADVLNEAV